MTKVLVVGGGIGGLAAALAASRAGQSTELFEKAAVFGDVGAGIQLGPNASRVLRGWGLSKGLDQLAFAPERLQVRSAVSGHTLGELRLGSFFAARYGAPYITVHRADLHGLLLAAVRQTSAVLHTDCAVEGFAQTAQGVTVQTSLAAHEADAMVAADGLWSATRQQILGDGMPRRTGHLAYRALVRQSELPEQLRSRNVTVWLGPKMHAVQYPVRGGEWLNHVVIIHGDAPDDFQSWDHHANRADLGVALEGNCRALHSLLEATPDWRLWIMHDRPPLRGAYEMAQGRVALLGDAAHPMRPYLAQGAGMAIEDAQALEHALKDAGPKSVPSALQQYAQSRWQRNASVQARALRNGDIFHAEGLVRWGRDMAMKFVGEKLLDMPWLYGFEASAHHRH